MPAPKPPHYSARNPARGACETEWTLSLPNVTLKCSMGYKKSIHFMVDLSSYFFESYGLRDWQAAKEQRPNDSENGSACPIFRRAAGRGGAGPALRKGAFGAGGSGPRGLCRIDRRSSGERRRSAPDGYRPPSRSDARDSDQNHRPLETGRACHLEALSGRFPDAGGAWPRRACPLPASAPCWCFSRPRGFRGTRRTSRPGALGSTV